MQLKVTIVMVTLAAHLLGTVGFPTQNAIAANGPHPCGNVICNCTSTGTGWATTCRCREAYQPPVEQAPRPSCCQAEKEKLARQVTTKSSCCQAKGEPSQPVSQLTPSCCQSQEPAKPKNGWTTRPCQSERFVGYFQLDAKMYWPALEPGIQFPPSMNEPIAMSRSDRLVIDPPVPPPRRD